MALDEEGCLVKQHSEARGRAGVEGYIKGRDGVCVCIIRGSM
jgi:hypothetical protein